MNKRYQLSLHIFRRDLRLQDNTALLQALKDSTTVLPCFIFDKRQIEQNEYKGDHTLAFMGKSLYELDASLQEKGGKLYYFYGIAEEIVAELLTLLPIEAVFINRDYTPFSKRRDEKIAKHCHQKQIDYHVYADALLNEPEQVLKANGEPYTIFTPAFHKASQLPVASPRLNTYNNYYSLACSLENSTILPRLLQKSYPNLLVKGGRKEALALLKAIPNLKQYEILRDIPSESSTTKLSAHHKFGTLSVRETYAFVKKTFGSHHLLIKELYWRDFFTHIGFYFPHVFTGAFHPIYDKLTWVKNEKHFQAWAQGKTGFPIVDAGMRELNTTGYMHNRVRMIAASFLTKDLHMDWRLGEKYFAQQLVDYDAAVNNGNWQWAASTGCDAQPYFRIFNPWLQQQKFDPDCLYIKRWIPELAHLPAKAIHALQDHVALMTNYPEPIVNHATESELAKRLYKQLKS